MSIQKYQNRLLSREEYYCYLKELEALSPKDCPFCHNQEYLTLKKFVYWNLVFCNAPYWKYHLMLVPKRHFKRYTEMSSEEQKEFNMAIQYTLETLQSADLKYNDGGRVEMFLFFWRVRDRGYDPVANVKKTEHFHFHIAPEKEHMLDPVLDKEAFNIDVKALKKLFKDN